ncbi:hypothetical protein [Streptomyces sp. NPDC056452]|uniref:hypothetical protein n=1 Tax=Streptomyces sp. NPDC056452 TaxID=3345821 RepID=UPI00367F6FE6
MLAGNFRTALLFTYASVVAPAAAVLPASPAHAAAAAPITSCTTAAGPTVGSSVSAQIGLDGGELRCAVSGQGVGVPSPAPIGIETVAADLTKDLACTGRQDRAVTAPNEHWGHTPPA